MPVWPFSLKPQEKALPSSVIATVWCLPHAPNTHTLSAMPGTSQGMLRCLRSPRPSCSFCRHARGAAPWHHFVVLIPARLAAATRAGNTACYQCRTVRKAGSYCADLQEA